MFYFVFCVVVLSTFSLSLALLRHGVICRLAAVFYLYDGDSKKQYLFDQLKISNYDCQYILELQIF